MGVLKREAKQLTPNGLGILHYSDGFFDVGQYKDGLLDGFGRVQLSGGDAYQG
jgi:PAX-interacting protein 1